MTGDTRSACPISGKWKRSPAALMTGAAATGRCKSAVVRPSTNCMTPSCAAASRQDSRLRPLGIELKAHVPEVGRNLENHPGVNIQYATRYQDSLVSELGLFGQAKLGFDWLVRKKGLGATNFFETGAFLKTRSDLAFPN